MIFEGFSKVFSTAGEEQYSTIGLFWDEMAAAYGRENLRGLGCHWTRNSIEYVIGLKEGALPAAAAVPEGAVRTSLILPDHGWQNYTGRTAELSSLYDTIYRDGSLDYEIETFSEDGCCGVSIFRRTTGMEALESIMNRRSYRGRYCSAPVPLKDLQAIVEAGLAAPSGCNKQTTSIAAVNTREMMERILTVIDPPVASTAPAGIFVLTRRIYTHRNRCYSVHDYAAAIENMLIAITSMGYAGCWYEGHITDEDRICDRIAGVLGIPEEYELVCFIPVGIPETLPKAPNKKSSAERSFYIGCQE